MSVRKAKVAGNARQRFSTEERQDEIVRAAVDLAGTQGVDNVTTQGIAEVIGVTQGAIFRHFPSKDTIWIAVVHWVRGRLMSVVDMAASRASDPLDAVERIFYAHIGFAEKNPAVPRLLLTTSPRLKQLLQDMLAAYEAKLTGLLGEAKAQGLVRSDLDEQGAAALFVGIVQGLVTRVLILGPKKSLIGEAKKVFPIYLAGIGGRSVHDARSKAGRQVPRTVRVFQSTKEHES